MRHTTEPAPPNETPRISTSTVLGWTAILIGLVAAAVLALAGLRSDPPPQTEAEPTSVEQPSGGVTRSVEGDERSFAEDRPASVPVQPGIFPGAATGELRSADGVERWIARDFAGWPPGLASSANGVRRIDTKTWTTYASDRYDFKVGHPPDWTAVPASRDWRGETDAGDPRSPAHEAFLAPDGAVRVSVWSVPLDPGTRLGWSMANIETSVEDYCQASGNTACTGIYERAVGLCLEKYDCHPGLLVPFRNDVQAFFGGGIYDARALTVVAVWRGESSPAVAPYGGSQRLLEAFLSTMKVWPASTIGEDPVTGRRSVNAATP